LPTGVFGVFLGYRFAPGGSWNGEYLVEEMTYFLDVDFSQEAPGHSRVLTPHVTKQVRLPANGKVIFPLKRHYDRVNFTFEGQNGQFDNADDMFDLPDGEDPPPLEEPRIGDGGDVTAIDSEQVIFDYGVDSLGRKYPRDKYGNRVILGNPRPADFPREIWSVLTKKQKQEFLEIYKKSKSKPAGEGEGPQSTKPSDFSGAPKSDASIVATPIEEVVKPLPCELHVDHWLSTLSSADAHGGVVAATMLHVDQHREKCALPLAPPCLHMQAC